MHYRVACPSSKQDHHSILTGLSLSYTSSHDYSTSGEAAVFSAGFGQTISTQPEQPKIFPPRSQANLSVQQFQCRREHTAPKDWNLIKSPSWQDQTKKEVFDKYGVPGFLSKDVFNQTYQKYIEHLAGRLNEFVAGAKHTFGPLFKNSPV